MNEFIVKLLCSIALGAYCYFMGFRDALWYERHGGRFPAEYEQPACNKPDATNHE